MSQTAKPLGGGDSISICLHLLMALGAAGGSVQAADFAREFDLDEAQLDSAIDMLQSIADERTGARVAITRHGGAISLLGDAGILDPLRLTEEEALALHQALTRCGLGKEILGRLESALGPAGWHGDDGRLLAGDGLLGGFYPLIAEALSIGARLRMSYRAADESMPAERVIDPGYIEVVGEAAYLVAWNVEKDAQRSYRLDRIDDLSLTDDSVTVHPFARLSLAESLREHGAQARVRWASQSAFDACPWAGIDREHAVRRSDGYIEAPVYHTSAPWLFDRILALGGRAVICAPQELVEQFVAYA